MRILFVWMLAIWMPICFAQNTVEGLWRTIDDASGEAKSLVRIQVRDGKFYGVVEKILTQGKAAAICENCPGDRFGVPIEGLEIIRDMQQKGDRWSGGTILDPNSGKVYQAKMSLKDNGNELAVRGFIGFSLLGRTQIWQRVE